MINSQAPNVTTGRTKIFISEDSITKENVIRVVEAALLVHNKNVKDMEYLFQLYRGLDPVIEERVRNGIHEEVNNKVNVPYYSLIADYAADLFMQNPIVMVNADGEEEVSNAIVEYNKIHRGTNKYARDKTTALHVEIGGVGYRFIEMDNKTIIKDSVLAPTSVMSLYGDDTDDESLAKVLITQVEDEENELIEDITKERGLASIVTKNRYTVYTDEYIYSFEDDNDYVKVDKAMSWGCPIVEYKLNSMYIGSFERVIGIIRALSMLRSDAVNGVEQSITGVLFGKNLGIPMDTAGDTEEQKEANETIRQSISSGIRKFKQLFVNDVNKDAPASLEYIDAELYNSDINVLYQGLISDLVTITSTPAPVMNMGASGNSGAAETASGVRQALTKAKSGEAFWFESVRRQTEIELGIAHYKEKLGDLEANDIEFSMNRVDYDDIVAVTTAYGTLKAAKIPDELIAEVTGISGDPSSWANQVDNHADYLRDKELEFFERQREITNANKIDNEVVETIEVIKEEVEE